MMERAEHWNQTMGLILHLKARFGLLPDWFWQEDGGLSTAEVREIEREMHRKFYGLLGVE